MTSQERFISQKHDQGLEEQEQGHEEQEQGRRQEYEEQTKDHQRHGQALAPVEELGEQGQKQVKSLIEPVHADQHMPAQKGKSLLQFMLFGMIGIINTLVDLAAYWLLLQLYVPYILANVVSYGAGMLNSYILNNALTFRAVAKAKHERSVIVRFIVWNLFTLAVSSSLMLIAVETLLWSSMWSKLIVTACIVVVQFVGTKKWVFRQ